MYRGISEELLDFLQKSPTAFHAVENIKEELNKQGFVELLEGQPWKMVPGGKYYVTRNNSSIIALKVGSNLENYSFNVAASHSDWGNCVHTDIRFPFQASHDRHNGRPADGPELWWLCALHCPWLPLWRLPRNCSLGRRPCRLLPGKE